MIRLDKYISDAIPCTRKEATAYIKSRRVTVDGKIINAADTKIDEKSAVVAFDGKPFSYSKFIYIMLNKPEGLISATEDERDKTVIVGDQIFADVMAGRFAGIRTFLTTAIFPEEEPWYTRMKRPFEKVVMRFYNRKFPDGVWVDPKSRKKRGA